MKKKILIIQSIILLIPIVCSFLIDSKSSFLEDIKLSINSRFLEILRAESSVSDSRLEYIGMILLKDKIYSGLKKKDKVEFAKNMKDIVDRQKIKHDDLETLLEDYRTDSKKADKEVISLTKSISLLTNIGLIAVITVFILNSFLISREKSKENTKQT